METSKIELPNGGWAVLRDPAAVPVRLRRPVEKLLMAVSNGRTREALENVESIDDVQRAAEIAKSLDQEAMDEFYELNDLLVLARVQEWSFDFPVTRESIGDLPSAIYEKLQKACSKNLIEMIPDFGQDNNPDSPTNPSDV